MDFDPEKHTLGKLCPRGHEYKKTGKTLRRSTPGRVSGNCDQCTNFLRRTRYKDRIKEGARKYRKKNREAIRAYTREWYRKRPYRRRPQTKREKEAYHLNRLFLSDKYISELFWKTTGIYVTDPNMIKAKREQLLMHREFEKIRLELKGDENDREQDDSIRD